MSRKSWQLKKPSRNSLGTLKSQFFDEVSIETLDLDSFKTDISTIEKVSKVWKMTSGHLKKSQSWLVSTVETFEAYFLTNLLICQGISKLLGTKYPRLSNFIDI